MQLFFSVNKGAVKCHSYSAYFNTKKYASNMIILDPTVIELCMTRKMVPITVRVSSFLEKNLYARMLGLQIKIERRKRRRRQKNNRPINLPQGNNILHILHVQQLTLNFIIHNKYNINTIFIYIHIYIHTYIHTFIHSLYIL